MKMFFSPSTLGFYNEDVHGFRKLVVDKVESDNPNSKIPADAVAIGEQLYADLLAGQSAGKVIKPDGQGRPTLVDTPAEAFPKFKQRKLAGFRESRDQALNRLVGMGLAAQVAGDTGTAQAACLLRTGLLDLPSRATVTGATSATALDSAVAVAVAELVAGAPVTLRSALDGLA